MRVRDGNPGRIMLRIAPLLLFTLLVVFAAPPALADKVVLFKNGKSIRAKSVKEDKGWTRLELEGGLVGVRSVQISMIQEAAGNPAGRPDALPNQASGVGGGGGYAPSYGGGDAPAEAPPPAEEYQPPQTPEETQGNPYRAAPGLPSNIPGLRQPGSANGRGGARFGGGVNRGTGLSGSRFGSQQTPNLGRQPINGTSNNGDE